MRNPLSDKIVNIPPSGIRRFFDIVSEMPDAISLGVGGIMNAKRVVLLATGEGKAKAIRDSINKEMIRTSAEDLVGKTWNAKGLFDRIL